MAVLVEVVGGGGDSATAGLDLTAFCWRGGASVLVSDGCAVARVGRVGTPDVWLQPGPWWFLASGIAPLLLAGMVLGRAWWPALRRPLMDLAPSADVWLSVVSARCGWLWRLVVLLRLLKGSMVVVVCCRLIVGMCSNSG